VKKTKAVLLALVLAVSMIIPTVAIAAEPTIRVEEEQAYVPLRQIAYMFGASAEWDDNDQAAIITTAAGDVIIVVIAYTGGFLDDGVAWVPVEFVEIILIPFLAEVDSAPVDRLDLTLWYQENFEDVREPMFSTDLAPGVIAVNYIQFMNDYLPARSAFTYRELETAVWIVEELLAMGHDFANIEVQEFTYWEVNEAGVGLSGGLFWGSVTSPGVLGIGREYQLRPDRVSQNVVITIPGQTTETIVVMAHYDSPPYPSASDNASGVALLLESAQRILEEDNYYTIVYAFLGAEEVGLIGADWFIHMLTPAQASNIVLAVNADVIIEGPVLLYAAGMLPVLNAEEIAMLQAYVFESMYDIFVWQFEFQYEQLAAAGLTFADLGLPIYSVEDFMVFAFEDMASMPAEMLLLLAADSGLVEPAQDEITLAVSALFAEIAEINGFALLSIPEAVAFPTDALAFLFEGFRVVNFVGLEDINNLDPELKAQFTRLGEGFGDLTVTILHSPLDDFYIIEEIWPGMMNDNLKAFVLLLQALLLNSF